MASTETRIMSSIELTPSQKTILQELINLHKESDSAVKGEDIADELTAIPEPSATRCRA